MSHVRRKFFDARTTAEAVAAEAMSLILEIYRIVACCLLAGVNLHGYLADVLLRVQTHPAKDIAELLPENRRAAREAERAVEAGIVESLGA